MSDEEFDDEEEFEEETFICRVCKKEIELGDGDDHIHICDNCIDDYDIDKIWDAYDKGKISDDELTTFDLMNYLSKQGKKKYQK